MGLILPAPGSPMALKGRLSAASICPDGSVRERREGDNVITVGGYTLLAQALVWSGIQDQAANLGITGSTYLTPLYGAVGSGAGTPALKDTALFSELGRETVGGGAAGPATSSIAAEAVWLFYFPSPATAWTVTEAGLFGNATSVSGSGTMIDHWAFSPSITVPTTDTLLLQVGLFLGP